ncbi:1-phosphofructokinase [Lachnospiraceae bacterium KM106-2]|nr:1-phosphofructokinase [Lachnospiraceae bacterium KM106-2]
MILTVTLNAAIDKRYKMERLNLGKTNRVNECRYWAGGKGINVARYLVLNGEKVMATGFIGGFSGDYIKSILDGEEIVNKFVRVKAETRSCITILNKETNTQTRLLEPGGYVTEIDQEQMLITFTNLVKECSVVVLSGSLPKGVTSSLYQYMIRIAHEWDCKVVLDISHQVMLECLKERPDVVILNQESLEKHYEKSLDCIDELTKVAIHIKQKMSGTVVATSQRHEVIAIDEVGIYKAVPPVMKEISSVGFIDAVAAIVAAGIQKEIPINKIVKQACAVGMASTRQAMNGFYLRSDLAKVAPKIQLEAIQMQLKKEQG